MKTRDDFIPSGIISGRLNAIVRLVPAFVVLAALAHAAEPVGSGKLIPHWGAPVWAEEFNVDGAPDPNVWSYQLASRNNPQEQQYYTDRPENVRVEGGALILELRKDNAIPPGASDWQGSYEGHGGYTSGFIYSNPEKKDFLFGRIEFRAKLPIGSGSWPALWTTGNQQYWPACGEIDVMEFWGSQENQDLAMPFVIAGTSHWDDELRAGANPWDRHVWEMNYYPCPDPSADWHIYAMEWDAEEIRYFYDDVCYSSTDLTPAVRSELSTIRQALRLNLAFDGAADSPITNLKMYVDYVREFQLQPGVRVHASPSVGLGGNWWTGETLSAFTNQPLPLVCTVEGDGMPGGGLAVEWQQLNGPARATFTTTTATQTTVTFPAAGMYDIRAVGHDGQYGSYAWRRVIVTDGSGNTPPQVAASDRKVMAGHPMKMEVAVADDGRPGGTPTVNWYKMLGQEPTFSDVHSRTPTVTFNSAGTVLLGVTASDGALDSTEAMVRVTVVPAAENQAPQVSAGDALNIALGATIDLPGAVSDDGYPEFRTTQRWTQVSGPATAAVAHPTWVNSAATFNAGGTYVLRLTATDGAATTSSDLTVTVGMTGNHAPTITTAKPAALACSRNTAGTVQLAATDADSGDTLTWSVTTAPAHGTATVGTAGLARYTPASGYLGTDSFIVKVSDGHGGTDTITINCSVTSTAPQITAVTATPAVVSAPGTTIMLAAMVVPGTGHPIDRVTFTLDGAVIGNATYDSASGTWKRAWTTASLGRKTITATAYGNDAQTATGTASVVVGTAGTFGNGGAPWAVGAGTLRLEAENYDEGGEGVASHDTDDRQGLTTVRTDGSAHDVDIVAIEPGTDFPGLKIGYVEPGEWLRYTLTVPVTGIYNVRLRVANGSDAASTGAISLRWKGAVVAGPLTVPATGSWDTFVDLDVPGVALSAGTDLLQLDCNTGGFDCNWIEFVPEQAPTFASWIAGYFPGAGGDAAIVGAAADPDGDGLSNLLEYGLARRPDLVEQALAPTLVTVGGDQYAALTFTRALGVSVVAEISDDLVTWSDAAAAIVQVGAAVPDASGLFETVTFRSSTALVAKPRQFLRARITLP